MSSEGREGRSDHHEKTVQIRRCACVVKGGRRFSFTALVVVGDGKGRVGYGYGKAGEVPGAIEKATKQGNRSLVSVPIVDTTVPHEVIGRYRSSRVKLIPAKPGTGLKAGEAVRAVVESAGDCRHPHEMLWLDERDERRQGDVRRIVQTADARTGRRSAGSGSLMILDDVHRGITKHKTRKRDRSRPRFRSRQDRRPRP